MPRGQELRVQCLANEEGTVEKTMEEATSSLDCEVKT